MSVLHTLAIILGILLVATRLPGLLWPKGFREHSMKLMESDLVTRAFAFLALIIGLIIVIALVKSRPWLELVLLFLAMVWLPIGAVTLWKPDLYRRLANKVLLTNDLTLRALCTIGVLVGFLLFFLGIFG
jgi:hypothetical protein